MEEIVVRLEVPSELEPKLKIALAKLVKQLTREVRFSILDEIMSKSTLTDEQVEKLASNLKERVAKRHGL